MAIGTSVSIDDLFLAGILPGVLMLVALSIYRALQKPVNPAPKKQFNAKDARLAIKDSALEIPLPFLVLGGIYGGFFAISEAAALTAIYVLTVTVIIRREISFRKQIGRASCRERV